MILLCIGAVTFHKAQATKSNGCLPNAEVYDAEAVGAFKAIKLARYCARKDLGINKIILFLRQLSGYGWNPGLNSLFLIKCLYGPLKDYKGPLTKDLH